MAFTEAQKVMAVVITSSPRSRSRARQESWSAAVHELTAAA